MPELLLEIFSEEIPARMQQGAARDLERMASERLRAAGVEVVEGVRADAAAALRRGFLTRVTQGRPMVTLKLATSFDGRIATAAGESRRSTGPAASPAPLPRSSKESRRAGRIRQRRWTRPFRSPAGTEERARTRPSAAA